MWGALNTDLILKKKELQIVKWLNTFKTFETKYLN